MFNSVALDVVIGLVFIYLLYSLLVTVISELMTTMLSLRARNLKEAIDRMLNDEKPSNWGQRLLDSLKLTKNPKNPVVNAFYDHPEIKYLGSSGVFRTPSYFKAANFSKTVLNIIFGEGKVTKEMINSQIDKLMVFYKDDKNNEKVKEIDKATADYIRGLWAEAQEDVDIFKKLLENWFDRTMEQTIEWYKRKLKVITLILGFLLAWFFNADTFVNVKNLSNDKEAREKMVSMANAYIESDQYSNDVARIERAKAQDSAMARLDSLLLVSKQLQVDIVAANNILGLGCMLPDSAKIIIGPISGMTSVPIVESSFIKSRGELKKNIVYFDRKDKWCYVFWLFYHHFFGYLVTAIAISLGAPFWFDLLSKVMQVRAGKRDEQSQAKKAIETTT